MNFEGLGDFNMGYNPQTNISSQTNNLINPIAQNQKSNPQPTFNFEIPKSTLVEMGGISLGNS